MSRWKLSMTYLRYSNMKLAKWNCCTIVKNLLYNKRKNLRRPKHCRGVHTQILPPYISIDVGEAFCYHSAWSSYTDVQVKTLHVYPKRKIVYKYRWGLTVKKRIEIIIIEYSRDIHLKNMSQYSSRFTFSNIIWK